MTKLKEPKRRKNGQRFTPDERERKVTEAVKLSLDGVPPIDIAPRIGVSLPTACEYLKKHQRDLVRAARKDALNHVASKLLQYAAVRQEAFEAWQTSQLGDDGTKRAGDSAFLRIVLDSLKAEREILGLDAPTKTEERGLLAVGTVSEISELLERAARQRSCTMEVKEEKGDLDDGQSD